MTETFHSLVETKTSLLLKCVTVPVDATQTVGVDALGFKNPIISLKLVAGSICLKSSLAKIGNCPRICLRRLSPLFPLMVME